MLPKLQCRVNFSSHVRNQQKGSQTTVFLKVVIYIVYNPKHQHMDSEQSQKFWPEFETCFFIVQSLPLFCCWRILEAKPTSQEAGFGWRREEGASTAMWSRREILMSRHELCNEQVHRSFPLWFRQYWLISSMHSSMLISAGQDQLQKESGTSVGHTISFGSLSRLVKHKMQHPPIWAPLTGLQIPRKWLVWCVFAAISCLTFWHI